MTTQNQQVMKTSTLDESVARQIKEEKWVFVGSSFMTDSTTRVKYPGLPWDKFPSKEGRIEGIGISRHPNGDFGGIYISTIDGKLVHHDSTLLDGGKLSEVPETIIDAVESVLIADRNAFFPRAYELYHAQYNWGQKDSSY